MIKVMIFIDGTWLYNNRRILRSKYGKPDFQIDYGKLPRALAAELSHRMGIAEKDVDVVRTYLFGSAPWNYDMRDDDIVQKQLRFYEVLREDYHYEVEIYRIDFRGASVRRDENDPHIHKHAEKCVDVALATAMLYFAAVPHVYDIAVAVVGDRDYVPALQHIRRLGRRVAIASIEESCHKDYKDPMDRQRIKDFDIIYLSSMLDRLELSYQMQRLRCDSPLHVGDRTVWDSYRPHKGEKFYCRDCRTKFAEQRKKDMEAVGLINDGPPLIISGDGDVATPRNLTGLIK
ncbi:MAG: NYN domain-containing protein, partial [Deltaproteobacteria bacterium]|nr:NYN domain-containing protein [Deltaproteobacteria bacterium]